MKANLFYLNSKNITPGLITKAFGMNKIYLLVNKIGFKLKHELIYRAAFSSIKGKFYCRCSSNSLV